MLETFKEQIDAFLGYTRDIGDVNAIQMALRTVLVYAVTLLLIRLGSKRFLSEATAFDVIVGIMLGSVMSRAINRDRKSTRLNSSHANISYAVFCLKKKNQSSHL